jgi:uncharacterized protein YjiK
MSTLVFLSDIEAITYLRARGYVVRHESEAPIVLSWNTVLDVTEAEHRAASLVKIREQLQADMLEYRETDSILRCYLRILR